MRGRFEDRVIKMIWTCGYEVTLSEALTNNGEHHIKICDVLYNKGELKDKLLDMYRLIFDEVKRSDLEFMNELYPYLVNIAIGKVKTRMSPKELDRFKDLVKPLMELV